MPEDDPPAVSNTAYVWGRGNPSVLHQDVEQGFVNHPVPTAAYARSHNETRVVDGPVNLPLKASTRVLAFLLRGETFVVEESIIEVLAYGKPVTAQRSDLEQLRAERLAHRLSNLQRCPAELTSRTDRLFGPRDTTHSHAFSLRSALPARARRHATAHTMCVRACRRRVQTPHPHSARILRICRIYRFAASRCNLSDRPAKPPYGGSNPPGA
jgi:hypothetical protein